ncbi:S41 family peptidase [Candidatus Gracilibacteria bacterium]|nr:S41 family peptidase [Candidatus Gracilibacteria bacterium]
MNSKQNKNFLTFFLIYLTIFLLGFLTSEAFDFYNAEQKLIIIDKNVNNSKEDSLNLDKYFSVYDKIKDNYYDFGDVKKEDLVEKSIVGLVSGLNDPYTEYFNPNENKNFMSSLSGDFEGIGAVLEKVDLGVKITSVVENSPAETAGIKPGDIVTDVNGTNIAKMSTTEVIALIKGPAGKEVNLVLKRGDETIEKQLFTKAIVIPSIAGKEIDDDIGYIGVATFGDKTGTEFKKELEKLKNKKGIIIDLRDNGGGYLEIAVNMLENFIKRGDVIAYTKYKDGKKDTYYSRSLGDLYNGKIVVLMNGFSASASEIFAGVMKDYQKAILVGEKTYGKGSVQQPIELKDGSMIKITIAKWFTPKDKNIDKEGIEPDVEVKLTKEDVEKKYDRQLEEAKKILKSYLNSTSMQLSIDNYKKDNK